MKKLRKETQFASRSPSLIISRDKLRLSAETRTARVIARDNVSVWISPLNSDSTQKISAHPRGRLKQGRVQVTNLIAVGDLVAYSVDGASNSPRAVIDYVLPRRTILSRAETLNHRQQQIIAANIDVSIIVFSLCQPKISITLIDRYLIAASLGGLDSILVITKSDLLDDEHLPQALREEEKEKLTQIETIYPQLGIACFQLSPSEMSTLESLSNVIKGKACVLAGPSGVGKSSLLQALTGQSLRIGRLAANGRGRHTTTHPQLLPLSGGGWCIDTPGLRSLALWQLDPKEVASYFPEIQRANRSCAFENCAHQEEERCGVKQAVAEAQISPMRYASYLRLRDELTQKHKRR